MRVTYLMLQNVAGLWVGTGHTSIKIDFTESKNNIVAIQGENGRGKSVLVSSISPFAGPTALDERSSLSFILQGEKGYKEIHYQDGNDEYIIKHFYTPKENSHTVKSYFIKNGEELNETGNVRSFLSLVETNMGLTQDMMRLIRLGTNVNSFISLAPAARKEYIGKLIEEIDLYLRIHKKVNKDILVVKALLQTNGQNLRNCRIDDPDKSEKLLRALEDDIKTKSAQRDKLIAKMSKLQTLMNDNSIEELRRKKREAESALDEYDRTNSEITQEHLEDATVEQLIKERTQLSDTKSEIQGRINAYRISIDNVSKSIEKLEMNIKRITSNNDMQSLVEAMNSLISTIENTPVAVQEFRSLGSDSIEVSGLLAQLHSYNKISQSIYSVGNKPIEIYLKLKRENRSVDGFLKEQAKKIASGLNMSTIKYLFDQIYGDDMIIAPSCPTEEYRECPYYRISSTVLQVKDKLEEATYDEETLHYIQMISRNIDIILNELDTTRNIRVPDKVRDSFRESVILNRMESKLLFFDTTDLQEYLTLLKEWELYCKYVDQLRVYKSQLTMYKKSGVEDQLNQIEDYKKDAVFYQSNIHTLEGRINVINGELADIDRKIGLVTKYQNAKQTLKLFQDTLSSTNKLLGPLENASSELKDVEYDLRHLDMEIEESKQSQKELEGKLTEYNRLMEEGKRLERQFSHLSIIQESVSTRKGIPVVYMNSYLGKIQRLANDLLKLIYDDDLQLERFEVTQDTFEIPYIKNGTIIPDVKYASQSELALITMALSFALSNKASDKYNILLLDEIDAGLDENNRGAFLNMLYRQMTTLKAEQVFMISHNLTQMINLPMDVIRLSNDIAHSKLQNVIYEI